MAMKNINKKVGCALIAASLLTMSSVRGAQGMPLPVMPVIPVGDPENGVLMVHSPNDYGVSYWNENSDNSITVVVGNDNLLLQAHEEQELLRCMRYSFRVHNTRFTLLYPMGFRFALIGNDTFLTPRI
jgi:hypothetical protein